MNISAIKSQQVSFEKKEETQKEPRFRNKGFIRGSIAKQVAAVPFSFASLGIVSAMIKNSKLGKEDIITIKKAASEAVTQSGLKDTGLKVRYVDKVNIPLTPQGIKKHTKSAIESAMQDVETDSGDFSKSIIKIFDKLFGITDKKKDQKALAVISEEIEKAKAGKISKFFNKYLKKLLNKTEFSEQITKMTEEFSKRAQFIQFKLGINSAYFPKANKILVSEQTLSTSVFHEIGHALNNNFSKIGKALQKMRPVALVAIPIISLLALTTKRKVEDKPKDRKINNGLDFVKRNAAPLTMLAYAPILIEEAMATIKGNGIAKNLLADAPKILKKVKVGNALGLASYTLAAVGSAIALKSGIKAKDNIQQKYEIKKMAKFEAKQAKLAAKSAQKTEA